MSNEKIIEQIIKDCFWDMDFSINEVSDIICSNDFRAKAFLFDKVLLNSTKLFASLKIFYREDLEKLIKDYKLPAFNKNIAKRRLNLVEVYFLDEPLTIEELSWTL